MYELTVTHHFDAAHLLEGHPKCGRIHGHRWEVDVTYQFPGGIELLDCNNMLVDFAEIKEVIDILDHPGVPLNNVLSTRHPTAEFIAGWLWENLPKPSGDILLSVSVWETPGCCVTFSGTTGSYVEEEKQEDWGDEDVPF